MLMDRFHTSLNRGDTHDCLNLLATNPEIATTMEARRIAPLYAAAAIGNAAICEKLLKLGARMFVPANDERFPSVMELALKNKEQFPAVLEVMTAHYAKRHTNNIQPGILDTLKDKVQVIYQDVMSKMDRMIRTDKFFGVGTGLTLGIAGGMAAGILTGAVPLATAIPALAAGVGVGSAMMVSHGAIVDSPAIKSTNPVKQEYDRLAHEYSNKAARSVLPEEVEVVYDGNFEGRICDINPLYVVQHIGRGDYVAHMRTALEGTPVPGLVSSIKYAGGHGKMGNELEADKGMALAG